MTIYHKLGKVPRRRHTTLYKEDGKSLYYEELVSSKGFSGIYTNKYHINMPTKFLETKFHSKQEDVRWDDAPIQHYHFYTNKYDRSGDFLTSRVELMQNPHVRIYTAKPDKNPDYFFKNAYAHEYIFVHHGSGTIYSDYGKLPFVPGDQIIIPQGTVYHMEFDKLEGNKLLVVESDTPYEIPKHYRNAMGQTEEHAPYHERDFKLPEFFEPKDEHGKFKMLLKGNDYFYEYTLLHHPYDIVGWDGYLYPWSFNIKDFAPKVGRLHLPPPVHLFLTTQHFVLCNFCPRLFDFDEKSIPAPYYHSNVDSAEVLYYAEGDFMSRKGVEEGSITLHPMGIPHGPQPGKYEGSVGAKETFEYAVMLDTFGSLLPTKNIQSINDEKYQQSWL